MKTHLMVKRNWLVSLFTPYKYYMACNSKRKFEQLSTNVFKSRYGKYVDGEVITEFQGVSFIGDCKNCMSTNVYKEMICSDTK